jgi:hypothetical protein
VSATNDDRRAGDVYARVIAENLERQSQRKTSIEQRGLSVISTSGALVTLQFALVAVITEGESFSFAGPEKSALGVSLVLFVVASVLGLLSNQTRQYPHISSTQLELLTAAEAWQGSSDDAARRVARAQVQMLRSARRSNGAKARLLRFAIYFEVGGVAALATCVGLILV